MSTEIGDALGPRGRRRAVVASAVSVVVLAGLVALALLRLADRGQLDGERWDFLRDGDTLRFLLGGLGITLRVAAVAMVLSIALGVVLALARLSRPWPVRWLAGLYVQIFRAWPLLLLVFLSQRGLRELGLDLSVFWYLVIALTAYNGAVLGEVFRAGIRSVEKGQTEAAYSVGLSYWQAMWAVVLPQAARRMLPAIVGQLITLLKDTSLGYIISFEELLRRGSIMGERVNSPLQVLTVVALMYLVVNLALSRTARRLEVRQRRRYGRTAAAAAGASEDLALLDAQERSGRG